MGKLSASMLAVVIAATHGGGVLVRSVHGYWTTPDCPLSEKPDWTGQRIPVWFTRQATVDALVKRGELEVTKRANGEAVEVRIPGALVCG